MMLLKRYLRLELGTLLRNNIRFRVIGRAGGAARRTCSTSSRSAPARRPTNTGMLFNIALNYGGRAEIVDAAPPRDRGRRSARRRARRAARSAISLHGRPARSRSADPHQRRDARQQFPAVADRLLGDLGHRNAVARFPLPASRSKPSLAYQKRDRRVRWNPRAAGGGKLQVTTRISKRADADEARASRFAVTRGFPTCQLPIVNPPTRHDRAC